MRTIGIISTLTLEHWDWNTPWITGVGGSEQSQSEWSQRLAALNHEVVSLLPLPSGRDDEFEAGVHWHQSEDSTNRDYVMSLPLVINFRNPTLFDAPKPLGARWWFVAQDVDYPGFWTEERLAKVDRYICLCKAHAGYTLQKYPALQGRVFISTNGVRASYISQLESENQVRVDFSKNPATSACYYGPLNETDIGRACGFHRKPHRMFYASSPDRGLLTLLKLWPRVLERVPDATLRVAYGFENMLKVEAWHGGTSWHTEYRQELEGLMTQRGVTFLGRLPARRVYEEWFQASLFPYPNCFKETSCISIMDAMSCGCVPVVNNLWAVGEHAKAFQPQVRLVDGDTLDSELARTLWLNVLLSALEKPPSDEERRLLAQDARDTYNWDRVIGEQIQPWIEEDLAKCPS